MEKKKRTKEDYPIVKYRIVTGNGYTVANSEEELKFGLERNKKFVEENCITERDKKRFSIQYIIKVTEEYIEL
jgi:5-formaminoimidazole-4-carboxamide-1-beta-D-ribofuranosyl 5'-monophosphate synthetase